MRKFLQVVSGLFKKKKKTKVVNKDKDLALLIAKIVMYKKAMDDCQDGLKVLSIQENREQAISDMLNIIQRHGVVLKRPEIGASNVIDISSVKQKEAS